MDFMDNINYINLMNFSLLLMNEEERLNKKKRQNNDENDENDEDDDYYDDYGYEWDYWYNKKKRLSSLLFFLSLYNFFINFFKCFFVNSFWKH